MGERTFGAPAKGNVFDVTRNSNGGRFFAVAFGGPTEVDLTPRARGSDGDDGAVAVGFAARWESPELRASDSDAWLRHVPRQARAWLTEALIAPAPGRAMLRAFGTCHVWPTTSTATNAENEVRSEFIRPPWTSTKNRNGPERWSVIRVHFRERGSSGVKGSQSAQDVRLSPPHQACGGGFPHEALTCIR